MSFWVFQALKFHENFQPKSCMNLIPPFELQVQPTVTPQYAPIIIFVTYRLWRQASCLSVQIEQSSPIDYWVILQPSLNTTVKIESSSGCTVNDKLQRLWKEGTVAHFNVPSTRLCIVTEDEYKKFHSG